MDVNQAILDLAVNPINNAEPCGINAKYEAAYEQLEAEIGKAQSLTSEATDWSTVQALAENLLSSTTKDFSVACYLAHAYTQLNGYNGLYEGFVLLSKMSESFWQDMYPPVKRLRGRQASCEWLIEQTSQFLEKNEPNDSQWPVISELAKQLKELDYFLADQMADKAPSFADISRPIKRLAEIAKSKQSVSAPVETSTVEAPAQKPAIDSSQATTTQSTPEALALAPEMPSEPAAVKQEVSAPAKAISKPVNKTPLTSNEPIGDIQTEQDAKKVFKQVQDLLKALSAFHSSAKTSDAKRYRYSRFALWGSLDKLPPSKDGKTQLPSPPADKLKKVVELFESGEYLELLNVAESSAEKLPYWFDGNRYIVLALEALGAEYEKAKDALISELTQFVRRVPKIMELQYANGHPFASEPCQAWLKSLISDDSAETIVSEDTLGSAMAEAKKLALSGKINEAFELLHEQPAKTKRDKFKIKMACAELACQNGQVKVGIPMLERMIEEIRSLSVADWESDFLSKALALLVNAYEKLDESELSSKQQQMNAAYDQLCWYNPALISQ